MKYATEELTARESLYIIAAMIQEAKGNVHRNNFYFLMWGWVIVAANLGMFALQQLGYAHPYAVWLITVPAWLYTIYSGFRRQKTAVITTHFDRISKWLWISFGITLFALVLFGYRINFQLNPVILLITAIPTTVAGVILEFKPLRFGGVIFWIGGLVCFIVPTTMQPLVGAVTISFGYLVPGYMLKGKQSANV